MTERLSLSAHTYFPHSCSGHPSLPPLCHSSALADQQQPLNSLVPGPEERLKSVGTSSIFSPHHGSPGSLRKTFLKLNAHPMSSSQRGPPGTDGLASLGKAKDSLGRGGLAWPLDMMRTRCSHFCAPERGVRGQAWEQNHACLLPV